MLLEDYFNVHGREHRKAINPPHYFLVYRHPKHHLGAAMLAAVYSVRYTREILFN